MFEQLKVWKALVENQSGKKIKVLRIDNVKEYINRNVQQLCEECGIQIQHSAPYTPQQNGVAERKNRSLKDMATCMIEGNLITRYGLKPSAVLLTFSTDTSTNQ